MEKYIFVKCLYCGDIFKRKEVKKYNKFKLSDSFLCSNNCIKSYKEKTLFKHCCGRK